MRRLIVLALLVAVGCTTLTGCFTYDQESNYQVWKNIKTDLRLMRQDLLFVLALEQESPLDSYYR